MKKLLLVGLTALAFLPCARAQSNLPTAGAGAFSDDPDGESKKQRQGPVVRFFHELFSPFRAVARSRTYESAPQRIRLEAIAKTVSAPISLAEEAAAKIAAEEAGAQSRRAAVRYLGTINFHYYPEAEAGLIAALRADRNDWVRLEAALALGNAPLASKRSIEALRIVVSGGDQDGNPREISEQVKKASAASLEQCLARGVDVPRPSGAPATIARDSVLYTAPLQLTGSTSHYSAATNAPPAATAAERAFAETFGAPANSTPAAPRPSPAPKRSGGTALTPIGQIPAE